MILGKKKEANAAKKQETLLINKELQKILKRFNKKAKLYFVDDVVTNITYKINNVTATVDKNNNWTVILHGDKDC